MALTPGERITLIKRIASGLAEQQWGDVDLTLQEFGLPWSDEWRGDAYDYAIAHVRQGSDQDLIALNAYLFPDSPDPSTTANVGGPWAEDHFRLFLSHTSAHKELAGDLRSLLGRWGIDLFVAHEQIEPTKEWQDEIESALRTCEALAALVTPDFVSSKWCDQEVGFCISRAVLILPVRMGADPHGFIGKYQALNVTADDRPFTAAVKIFDLLAEHDLTRGQMARPVVQRYVTSGSFDSTRAAYSKLVRLPKEDWTEALIEEVEQAARTNNQIENANLATGQSVPEAVTAHLDELLERGSAGDDEIPF